MDQVLQRIGILMGRGELGCRKVMPFQMVEECEPEHRGDL